jgi:dTMP kinase
MTEKQEPIFVVIEGPDAVGKSTQARLLAEKLEEAGGSVVVTSEPTKLPVGQMLRRILAPPVGLTDAHVEYNWQTLALLFTADRIMHAESTIRPALDAGKIVICDRYYLSTLVYQTAALFARVREGGPNQEERFDNFASARRWICELHEGRVPEPDLTVILTAPPDILAKRLKARGREDRFEQNASLMAAVDLLYRDAGRVWPSRAKARAHVALVDASADEEHVAHSVFKALLIARLGAAVTMFERYR